MAAYAVTYTYVPETEAMTQARPSHVDFLGSLHEKGDLLVSGRLTESDPLGALLIIRGESVEEIEKIMDADPFYSGGYVAQRRIQRWNIAFGSIEGAE